MNIGRMEIDSILEQSVPEKCRPCYRSDMAIRRIGGNVFAGEVSLEIAKQLVEDEFTDCRDGYIEGEGCFSGGTCSYGMTTSTTF